MMIQILMTAINLRYHRLSDGEQSMQVYALTGILIMQYFSFREQYLSLESRDIF